MRIKQVPVYAFVELDESAKEKAREWYRADIIHIDTDCQTDWLAEVCAALTIDLNSKKIYWCVSWSHGSSFEASVNVYKLLRAIENDALASVAPTLELPAAPTLHHSVRRALENRTLAVRAGCKAATGYGGEFNMVIDGENRCGYEIPRRVSSEIIALRKWAESVLITLNAWFFANTRADADYQYSAECIDEMLVSNDYEFDASGGVA